MITQWIIFALAIMGLLWYLKIEHYTQKIKILVLILIGFLIYFSIAGVLSSGKLDLSSPRGVFNAAVIYMGWAKQTATNLWGVGADTVTLVGNAIKINNNSKKKQRR